MLVVTGIFWTLLVLSVGLISWHVRRTIGKQREEVLDVTRDPAFQQRYSPIFPAYKPGRDWFTGFQLVTLLLRGIFIGACQVRSVKPLSQRTRFGELTMNI